MRGGLALNICATGIWQRAEGMNYMLAHHIVVQHKLYEHCTQRFVSKTFFFKTFFLSVLIRPLAS